MTTQADVLEWLAGDKVQCLGAYGTGCHPGIPLEQMTAPEELAYLAEVDELGPQADDIPAEPSELCWSCRRLWHAGRGPQAAILRDLVSTGRVIQERRR